MPDIIKMASDGLLQDIDPIYYNDEDPLNHLASQLPDELTSNYLLNEKEKLENSLNLVSKKVSGLILSHQPAYVDELKRISDLQISLNESIRSCSEGRTCLSTILGQSKNGVIILENYKKRETLITLLTALTTVDNLRKSIFEIRQLIDQQEDFHKAIKLCRDGINLLSSYHQYNCINELRTKLNELLDCIHTQAREFFNAYHKQSLDELKMFLENEVWELIPVKSDFKLVQLKEFHFLRSSSSPSFKISSLHNPTNEHANGNPINQVQFFGDDVMDNGDMNLFETFTKDSSVISQNNIDSFNSLRRDDDPTVSSETNDDRRGSFLQTHAPILLDKISLSSESDDELNSELNRDFVDEGDSMVTDEDEEDIRINVKSDANFDKHLANFSKTTIANPRNKSYSHESTKPNQTAVTGTGTSTTTSSSNTYVGRYNLTRSSGPMLTNSSLNLMRLFGRYIQIMIVLEPISYDILIKIYSLLEYYIMVVYKKFGPDANVVTSAKEQTMRNSNSNNTSNSQNNIDHNATSNDDKTLSPKLRQLMRSIRASLIGTSRRPADMNILDVDCDLMESTQATLNFPPSNNYQQQGPSNISNIITEQFLQQTEQGENTASPKTSSDQHKQQGPLIDRRKAVALESLVYLVNQLWNLQEYLESLIPADMRPRLREQFLQSNSLIPDFLRARAELGKTSSATTQKY